MMKSSSLCALAALGALGSFNAPAADPPDVEERLKKLEGIVETLQKENAALRRELGYDPKAPATVVKAAGKESKISIGGLLQGQAEFGDAPDARYNGVEDRFFLRRARLNVQGNFLEHFDFKLEADFSPQSLNEIAAYRAQLTDTYINWNRYELANIKVGQFKTYYGYEQLQPDPTLMTIERSLPNDRLTDGRQIGVGLTGSILDKRASYGAGLFNGTSVNNSFNDNDHFLYAARIQGIPIKTKVNKWDLQWTVGVNGLITKDNGANGPAPVTKTGFGFDSTPLTPAADNVFIGDRHAWGADTQLKFGPFDVMAEYLRAHFEPTDALPQNSFDSDGWYVGGGYYIFANKLQVVVKYETFNPNVSVKGDSTDVWTFGLNYYIKGDDLKLMVNYLLGDRAAAPGFPAKDNQGRLLLLAQVMF